MTPEAQRIKIAEACGWQMSQGDLSAHGAWLYLTGESLPNSHYTPNYPADLNAMHEAESFLRSSPSFDWLEYQAQLQLVCVKKQNPMWHATAAQRAQAFLKTLSLWDDAK